MVDYELEGRRMTKGEWFASEDPDHMIHSLRLDAHGRKLRLFACAIVRATGGLSFKEQAYLDYAEAWHNGMAPLHGPPNYGPLFMAVAVSQNPSVAACHLARECSDSAPEVRLRAAALLREIIHPFRPPLIDCPTCQRDPVGLGRVRAQPGKVFVPRATDRPTRTRTGEWLTCPSCHGSGKAVASLAGRVSPTIRSLALDVYERRAWELLPVLADALEEAGCDDAELLGHLRYGETCRGCSGTGVGGLIVTFAQESLLFEERPKSIARREAPCDDCRGTGRLPHVRGCWALDLVLGKG